MDCYPVHHPGFYEEFRRNVEVAGLVSERRTIGVVRTLSERVARLVGRATTAGERVALYRAYQTALYELAERADDSSGALGQERTAALLTYLDLDWRDHIRPPVRRRLGRNQSGVPLTCGDPEPTAS